MARNSGRADPGHSPRRPAELGKTWRKSSLVGPNLNLSVPRFQLSLIRRKAVASESTDFGDLARRDGVACPAASCVNTIQSHRPGPCGHPWQGAALSQPPSTKSKPNQSCLKIVPRTIHRHWTRTNRRDSNTRNRLRKRLILQANAKAPSRHVHWEAH